MRIKKYMAEQSTYFQFLQNLKNTSDKAEIENSIEVIKGKFPVVLVDKFTPSAIYIMDYKHQNYPYMSSSVESIIGYKSSFFYDHGIAFTFSLMHPDDVPVVTGKVMKTFLAWINTINTGTLNNYRFSFNFRARRSDGCYIQVLQQYTVALVDEYRNPLLYIGTITDISAIKKDKSIIFSVAKYDAKHKTFKEIETLILDRNNPLSGREVQVIRAIAEEKTNKEISDLLNISELTVKAHRRNIHKKTDCKRMSAVIAKCQREGWI